MNIKSLKEKVDHPISFPESSSHFSLLDEASGGGDIWDWIRRLFGADAPNGPPSGQPRIPDARPPRRRPDGPDGGPPDVDFIMPGRREEFPWEDPQLFVQQAPDGWRGGRFQDPRTGQDWRYHPNQSGQAYGDPNGGHYWVPIDGRPGEWHWEYFPDSRDVPASAFPQPTTPGGTPGGQWPGHGPNGFPLDSDGMPMTVNPDTGRPFTENPFGKPPYGQNPPWEGAPPPPTMRPPDSPYGPQNPQGSRETDGPTDAGRPAGLPPFNGGGNEGPRSAPPTRGTAYSPPAAPSRTLQGLRSMAGASK